MFGNEYSEELDRLVGEDVWLYVDIDVNDDWMHGRIFGTLYITEAGKRWLCGEYPGSENEVRQEFSFHDHQVFEIVEDEVEPIIRVLMKQY